MTEIQDRFDHVSESLEVESAKKKWHGNLNFDMVLN